MRVEYTPECHCEASEGLVWQPAGSCEGVKVYIIYLASTRGAASVTTATPFIQAASTILAKHSVNRKSNWSFFKTSDHLGFHTTLWFTLVDFIDFTPPKTNMDTQKTTNEKVKQNASTLGSSSLANSKSSLVTLESFRFSNLAVFFVKCCRSCQCTGVSTPYNISCDARGALHPHTDSGMLLYL